MREYTLDCDECKTIFKVSSKKSKTAKHLRKSGKKFYCCKECRYASQNWILPKKVTCKYCSKEFSKRMCDIRKSPTHFCSSSCAATYNNTNKTHGYRRSKLEIWLEEQLPALFPKLDFHFNRKDAVNSELDIYIPSLNLAFELNGIFHYEPIFGSAQLNKIQNNDNRKFQACLEKKIELCIIDSSKLSYFKPANAQKYLDIIVEIIKNKVVRATRIELV